ncbi:metal ABC transporter permease [Mycoplasmatota bacterium]|nr:metal ABC transporter permease [Mycoplasmatota bacterium]
MNETIQLLLEAITSTFILKALLVGILVAISSSFLGIFLVLKKYSMIGDGLAHVSFATIAIALFLGITPLYVSIPLVILASILILKLNEKAEIHGDAAIGLVASFSVALGYLIASYSSGFNVNLSSYLFGSILLVTNLDVILSIILSIVVTITVLFLYNSLFALTYDEEFSKVLGLNTKRLNYIISILTSLTIVLGIRVVGTMLISSLIIFPTVTALQVSKGFKSTIKISLIVSILSIIIGVLLSIIINSPTGSTIVVVNGFFFIAFYLKKKLG